MVGGSSMLFITCLSSLAFVCAATTVYDKTTAVGPCLMGRCPENHVCSDSECFPMTRDTKPSNEVDMEESVKSGKAIGPCVNALCPNGYDCIDNSCFKSLKRATVAIGPCINNQCPSGYSCNEGDYQCY
uniref:CC domain-containing protein n=1 Tax=Panagrellus redivivus TaxID=6233 RepID=A0A7E4VLP2_PANRE